LLHVVLVTVGTRGDVQPFVALGKRLTREGHRVTVATHDEYAPLVGGHGLGFRPMGGSFKPIVEGDLGRQWIESGDSFLRFLDLSRRVFEPLYATWARDAHDAVLDADLVLFHALTRGAVDAAEKRGVPAIGVGFAPGQPSAEHCLFFPRAPWGWLRRWLGERALEGMWTVGRAAYDEHRRSLGLTPFRSRNPWNEMLRAGTHFLYAYSPHIGHVPEEWPASYHVTGSWTLDTSEAWDPPPELVDFLASGPPPVYVGFGSMTGRSPEDLARLATDAVARAGQRAVLVTGWGGLARAPRHDGVLVMESVPHEWLFPRCSAVVHHGGAGTVAAGLAAGKPTVVTAFFGDQPYWGDRVHALGAGPAPIPRRNLDAQRLARALGEAVTDERYRRGAENVAAKLRAEDGVGKAVEAIRTVLGGRTPRA
jgi:sterol 3beta-glucosyltransferase